MQESALRSVFIFQKRGNLPFPEKSDSVKSCGKDMRKVVMLWERVKLGNFLLRELRLNPLVNGSFQKLRGKQSYQNLFSVPFFSASLSKIFKENALNLYPIVAYLKKKCKAVFKNKFALAFVK